MYYQYQREYGITKTNTNTNTIENFVSVPRDCEVYKDDTTKYAAFAPLIYDPKSEYYGGREYMVKEGIRRYNDKKERIGILQSQYDDEENPRKRDLAKEELQIHKWEDYILSPTLPNGEKRAPNDITTDYYPDEIGCIRPWLECHSHFPPETLNYYRYLDKKKPLTFISE